MNEFEELKGEYFRAKGRKDSLESTLAKKKAQLKELTDREANGERGREILQIVAQQTQKNLEYHLSSLVTTALKSISNKWPEFEAEITIKRNATGCDLFFVQNGVREDPMKGSGGGPLDVASFALRVAYWSLKKNRPTFILDEPFKFVSPDLQENVSSMLQMLSEKLGIQIVMVSHAENVNMYADRTFVVDKDIYSEVKEVA